MIKILHFADAHIDMANYGRHDPQSGLPVRVQDFLKSLDVIVDAAIGGRVDLVIFAGDAYKDRTPAPTFQREWGRRIMRLSRAGIPALLLVGNHDLSPALGRAHALETFDTLDVPNVRVLDKPAFLGPEDLWGLPLQVIALPWISRSGLAASLGPQLERITADSHSPLTGGPHSPLAGGPHTSLAGDTQTNEAQSGSSLPAIYEQLGDRLVELVQLWLQERADPALPLVLTAHCSVQGAQYGGERTVMLGNDLVLPGSIVKDPRLDYVALGHIHKPQDLNKGAHPPVIYPGSIERIDFGEAADDKFYILAAVERGQTQVEWRRLDGIRPFIDRFVRLDHPEGITDRLRGALEPAQALPEAIVRLVVEYPRDWEPLIDDAALREFAAESFEFNLVKRPQVEARLRLPGDQTIGSLTPLELVEKYWDVVHVEPDDRPGLNDLAARVITAVQE